MAFMCHISFMYSVTIHDAKEKITENINNNVPSPVSNGTATVAGPTRLCKLIGFKEP